MIQPDRFGPFLLFRETETNRYRKCFRAGITRGRAVERIIRLETFDPAECGSAELLEEFEAAADLQALLLDPHIARGAGVGQVDGTAFAAYDFELGTTLAAFSSAAREKSFPVPFDQALFVAERIALALAAAYRIDDGGKPVLHKFLTPDAVLLSNVGEIKVCGFETGGALRHRLAGEPFYAPYCSPEARAGLAPLPVDDVYSLGAILFELVTGRQHNTAEIDSDEIVVQATGEPAPENLEALLRGSFAPPASRIPNVEEWQQTLGKLILDGEYNPTTFNLAFLLHTILREPLEQGLGELEREKRFVLDAAPQPAAASPRETSTTGVTSTAPNETQTSVTEAHTASGTPGGLEHSSTGTPASASAFGSPEPLTHSARSGRKPFWLGFSLSVLSAGAALTAWLVLGGPSTKTPAATASADSGVAEPGPPAANSDEGGGSFDLTQPAVDQAPAAVVDESAAAPGSQLMLSEVVRGQVDSSVDEDEVNRVIAERAREIERNLRADYEKKLESLRAELKEGRPGDAETARPGDGVPSTVAVAPPLEVEPTAATPPATEAAAPLVEGPASQPAASDSPAAAVSDSGSLLASRARSTPANDPQATSLLRREISDPPQTAAAESLGAGAALPNAPTAAVATTGSTPESQRLAKETAEQPVDVPPQLVRLNAPTYPPAARRFGLSATARVKLVISAQGKVEDAEIIGPELGSGFDRAALHAARRSRWKPATRNGEPVASVSVVTLEFKP